MNAACIYLISMINHLVEDEGDEYVSLRKLWYTANIIYKLNIYLGNKEY